LDSILDLTSNIVRKLCLQELKKEREARAHLQEQLWHLNTAAATALTAALAADAAVSCQLQLADASSTQPAAQLRLPVAQHVTVTAVTPRDTQQLRDRAVTQQQDQAWEHSLHNPQQQQQQPWLVHQSGLTKPPQPRHGTTPGCMPTACRQQQQQQDFHLSELQQRPQLHVRTHQTHHQQQRQHLQEQPGGYQLLQQPHSAAAGHHAPAVTTAAATRSAPCSSFLSTPLLLPTAPARRSTPNTTPTRSYASSPGVTAGSAQRNLLNNVSGNDPAPMMNGGSSSHLWPDSTAPAAAAAAAAVLCSDAAELLSGAAAVRRSNDELLLAESVVSSSDSDSDNDAVARAHTTRRSNSRGQYRWGCNSSTCSSVATVSSNASREYARHPQHGLNTSTVDLQEQQQVQRSDPAAAIEVVPERNVTLQKSDSWHDSWDDEINLFCNKLLPPPDSHHSQPIPRNSQQAFEGTAAAAVTQGTPAAAAAAGGHSNPSCNRCRQLEVQLQELQFEADLASAAAAATAEERDLVLLQQQSLLDLIAQQHMQDGHGS
jgi:hypothetical protein